MKKFFKVMAVIAVCLVLLAGCGGLFVTYFKPHAIDRTQKIALGHNGEIVEIEGGDEFAKTLKVIKKCVNSARFSIFHYNERPKMPCDDAMVESLKGGGEWVELTQPRSHYKRLFFRVERVKTDPPALLKGEEVYGLVVFAARSLATYEGGKFINYTNCKAEALFALFDDRFPA